MEMAERIKQAHAFAGAAHRDQTRKFTGELYLTHLEETAQLLWEATDGNASQDMYIAAILHDVVEDTDVTLEEVGREFGGLVMVLVGELTIDQKAKEEEGKKLHLTRKINGMSEPAFLIKLCDRFSNVSGLMDRRVPDKFVKWYVKETQYILEHLDRQLTETQEHLTKKIGQMLVYLKLDRNF
jgi:(p)ppGpp synthase/HD superfamily hydrolase